LGTEKSIARERDAHPPAPDQSEHLCYEGVVYLGRPVLLPDGEEDVVYTPVPCRRCAAGDERF
jgi:hypothetical protein